MDKQQAAEAHANKKATERFVCTTENIRQNAKVDYIAGWEAREAQSPTDAGEFLRWVFNEGWWPMPDWRFHREQHNQGTIIKGVDDLYKLFNPSGAAPQTIKLPDDFYNCLPKGYEFVNEEPLVSNHYDAEENEIEGECVVVMIMKGKGDISALTPTQILPYGMLNAVYEGAGEWEARCRSAEDALKALVNMKQWKERSGKDEIYMRQQPLAWAEANNHLATYYEEYEKTPAPQTADSVVEQMAKALQQVKDFSTGKLGSQYLGCIIADCNAALQKYYESEPGPVYSAAGPVWVKGEYERLYNQVKGGKTTPCYVDHHWRSGDKVLRDIAHIIPKTLEPGARGIGYSCMSYDESVPEIDRFVEMCKSCNVEWLDANPAPQRLFTREQVWQAYDDARMFTLEFGSLGSADDYMKANYPEPK